MLFETTGEIVMKSTRIPSYQGVSLHFLMGMAAKSLTEIL